MPEAKALYYEEVKDGSLRCLLCPHHCRLKDGQVGLCRVRKNKNGVLVTSNYGEISSAALDPIEKKPLFHFYPGSAILSVGTFGCNLNCRFCQNYSIAHGDPPTECVLPESLVKMAEEARKGGSIGVAFTYNEPSVWYEYIREAAPMLKEKGLKTVLVSNGFMEENPLREILPFIDAANIDVKSFNEDFYRQICRGRLEPVLKAVEKMAEKIHVEVTTLLIPGKNDSSDEIRELCRWLAGLDESIPLHLNRYHPAYKMLDIPATPADTLYRARDLAEEYLNFVYIGNLAGEENSTRCPVCGNVLIVRNYFHVNVCGIKNRQCTRCGSKVDFIKMD